MLLNEGHSMTELIGRFQEYLEYDDVRYNSLACCSALLNEKDMVLLLAFIQPFYRKKPQL